MRIFGFEIKRPDQERQVSFAPPVYDDGAVTIGDSVTGGGGFYSASLNVDAAIKSEADLVTKYRAVALQPEIQQAVDDVVNDAISIGLDDSVVKVITDYIEVDDKVKEKISDEFNNILTLLDFSNLAYEIFSRWYVDGRINYHIIVNEANLNEGIKELRYIDPRKLRLIREMEDSRPGDDGIIYKRVKNEYYIYSEYGYDQGSGATFMGNYTIAKDSIARVTSGLLSEDNQVALSYLHKAIKPLNALRNLEDATIIYTLTRAPERRIFYIDTGNLPKAKAEQYMNEMINRYRNEITYDPSTGEVRQRHRTLAMTHDFWFPRREGSQGTQIDTLPGAGSLLDNEQLQYFQRKLYKALNVPITRLESEGSFSFGRASEISKDEVKFAKFIRRLRNRFSILFDEILEKQLILKGIITPDEWAGIRNSIRYNFMRDNFFEELKETEILRERMNTLREMEEHVGVYFSKDYVRRNILRMGDEEIKEMKEQIEKEKAEEPEEEDGGSRF